MKAPSKDIVSIIEDNSSLGLTFGTNLFIGNLPIDTPRNCVVISDTGGRGKDLGVTEIDYERNSVQIIVRNKNYSDGWDLISDIRDILHGYANTSISDIYYGLISCISGPGFLGWDDNKNALFFSNFEVQRREK
jgi:hypothetical protein